MGPVAADGVVGDGVTSACDETAGQSDFNGDGFDDAVVADPDATVDSAVGAGQVHVIYGDSSGPIGDGGRRQLLAQGMPGVGQFVEPDDHFGERVVAANLNQDRCMDLLVGVPDEDLSSEANAGVVHVIFGSPQGLGRDEDPLILRQGRFGIPGVAERGDLFGFSIAAQAPEGTDGTLVAAGVPGEDIGRLPNAGAVSLVFVSGFTASDGLGITQNTRGVPGRVEARDMFGFSVAVGFVRNDPDLPDLIAGVPTEDVDGVSNAGAITVVDDIEPSKVNFTGEGLTQNSPGIPGVAERGDRFGYSLTYEQVFTPSDGTLAIGVPFENIRSVVNAGMVHLLSIGLTSRAAINQDSPGIIGVAEPGDRFGLVLNAARHTGADDGVDVIVGIPFENIGAVVNAGAAQVFPATSPTSDFAFNQNSPGVVGEPEPGDRFGWAVDAAGTDDEDLLVGVPFDAQFSTGEAFVIPFDGAAPVQLLPGAGGIPATGAVSFGGAVAG